MADVRTKLMNAFETLKKEGKKISPFAVEKRAGVANGSCKNHPAILDMILIEKANYHPNPEVAKKGVTKSKKQVDKAKYDDLEQVNARLGAENAQFRNELKEMATNVSQLTWELHRYKTATQGRGDNVTKLKV